MNSGWQLRAVTSNDIDSLHALGQQPMVYRYLFDATPPSRAFIADRIAQAIASASETGLGMWLLEGSTTRYAGSVQLQPQLAIRSAEITYLLDPRYWGQGLAVRMAWTAITQAFLSPAIDAVIAGADGPNTASFSVMRRLGMTFHRNVQYPLGAGMEYKLHRDDAGPTPRPPLIPLR